MTFEEYFENKHGKLIEEARAEYDRINDPNFIELGAHYKRIGRKELITPIYYEWGVDENHHQMTWMNVGEKDTKYCYDNYVAPIELIKVTSGTGQYPPNRFRTKFHCINGEKIRVWCFTSRDYKTDFLSFEMRFHIGKTYHCVRGNTWNLKSKGCFMYLTELEGHTVFCKRDLTMREVKLLVFGDSNFNVSKINLNETLNNLKAELK